MKACTVLLTLVALIAVEAFGQKGRRLIDCGKSTCMVLKWPAYFERANGSVPMQVVYCSLKSSKIRDKCVLDISSILETLTTSQDVLLQFAASCSTPIHIMFKNSRNATKKNAISVLELHGHCSISAEDIFQWGRATDFRAFFVVENAALLEDNNSQIWNSSLRGLENIVWLVFNNSKPREFPSIFRTSFWPKMAEGQFSNLQLTTVPAELRTTMPLLQTLNVAHNNLTKPPFFPWSNSTLQLPRGLSRTLNENHLYQDGTTVHPKIYRRFFDLAFNNIEDLSTYQFRGFLNKLSLKGNGLKVIGPSCFCNLKGIQVIDIGRNNLEYLPSELFHGLDDLLELKLDHNNFSVVPVELFKSQTQIKRVDLNHNKLRLISEDLFCNLQSLEILHLEANQISQIDDEAFPIDSSSLREIYLQNNKITHVPKSLLLQPKANNIDLSFNLLNFQDLNNLVQRLDMLIFSFQHREPNSSPQVRLQDSLKQISFAHNNFTTINIEGFNKTKRAMFKLLLRVYKIDMTGNPLLCDCKILALVRWLRSLMQSDAPVESKQFLSWKCAAPFELKDKPILSVDEHQFKCQRNLENCPKQCTCLVRALDGTVVVDCKRRNLVTIPRKVPRGQIELHLQNNNIREIPPYPYLENVTALYLTHNKIDVLNTSTVQRLQRIKILFIDSNKLTNLPRNIENVTFTTLALHHNFFKCDCTTKWMKKWLRKQEARIQNIDNVLCNSENAQGKAIYTLPDEEFVCKEENNNRSTAQSIIKEKTFKIIALTLGVFLAVVLIVFTLAYKYRGEVKVFMYTHFNWHPFDRIDDSDLTKIYDAFVSYSGGDYEWVLNTLRLRLENHDPPYKLCIHHRDFLVGAPIQENILNSVNQSKRMIMVLSHNFIKSEWCLLEFRAAHRKVLEDRMNYLIIILFDDVNVAELDDEIKLYMRTNTYLSISNKWFWEKLCYALPRKASRANAGLEHSTETVFTNEAYRSTEILDGANPPSGSLQV